MYCRSEERSNEETAVRLELQIPRCARDDKSMDSVCVVVCGFQDSTNLLQPIRRSSSPAAATRSIPR